MLGSVDAKSSGIESTISAFHSETPIGIAVVPRAYPATTLILDFQSSRPMVGLSLG